MEDIKIQENLELIERIQRMGNYFMKEKNIKVNIGDKEIEEFPLSHIFLLPRVQRETILQNLNNIKSIKIDFGIHNDNICNFYSEKRFQEVFKNEEETIEIWHNFNKDKLWGYNGNIIGIKECIERLEEKWENGVNNFEEEINFINENIEEIKNKSKEDFIKNMPIEIYNIILKELPKEKKIEWLLNINNDKRIEAIKEINIKEIKQEEFENILNILKEENEGIEWIKDIDERIQKEKEEIKIQKEEIEKTTEKNEEYLVKIEEKIKIKQEEKEKLQQERISKEEHDKELEELERLKKEIEENNEKRKELETLLKEEKEKFEKYKNDIEEQEKIEKEGSKELKQIGNGLNKEQQFIEGSKQGFLYGIKKLLKEGINIETKDNCGYTGLMWASTNGHIEVVEELIKKGGDINSKNNQGFTSLIYASANGHLKVVQKLIEKGADINFKNDKGETALIWGSYNGHLEIVKELIEKGADVNAENKDGMTSLIWGSYNGYIEIVKELLNKGANVQARGYGKTALEWAHANQKQEIISLLSQYN